MGRPCVPEGLAQWGHKAHAMRHARRSGDDAKQGATAHPQREAGAFVNDVRPEKSESVLELGAVFSGGRRAKPDESQQNWAASSSWRFCTGDFQPSTDIGIRLDRRR